MSSFVLQMCKVLWKLGVPGTSLKATSCTGRAQLFACVVSVTWSLAIGVDTKSSGEKPTPPFVLGMQQLHRTAQVKDCGLLETHAGPSLSVHGTSGSHTRLSSHVRKEALRSTELDHWLIKHPEFQGVTSQGNQDGALEYIFHHIGVTNKYYVVRNACCIASLKRTPCRQLLQWDTNRGHQLLGH